MKMLVIADGRSPITRGWVGDLVQTGHQVVLVSTFPHQEIEGVVETHTLPICFANFAGSQAEGKTNTSDRPSSESRLRGLIRKYRGIFQDMRYWLGPLTFPFYRPKLKKILAAHDFDLVHVLRIPFEGLFAVPVLNNQNMIVSIWGNDLTLHAPKNGYMRRATRRVLRRADGLIVDVKRDIALAQKLGYPADHPVLVALTSGGIETERLKTISQTHQPDGFALPDKRLVINPRGIRPGYVRNDTFFAAVPKVIEKLGESVHFICPSMAGQPEAEQWVSEYSLQDAVSLLPFLSQQDLWYCFARSEVMVSPSIHDGTPNSLLESMALGAFPVVGDIASLREWITNGENGFLVDPASPDDLANAILSALRSIELRENAKNTNLRLVEERASRAVVREQREEFYNQIRNHPVV